MADNKEIKLKNAGNAAFAETAANAAPVRKPIMLLTYDHGGYILWGDRLEERIDSAIDWLQKYPKFKIGIDNECFAYDEYARSNPAIVAKIKKMLEDFRGRFAIGSCTYGQPLSVFINDESNARQIVYAIRANLKHFGQTPEIYAISEHALHNQIPQLANQAGYKGAIMRTHFMMYGYNPTYDAPFGTWIGEDGSRIPTVPTYDGEGAAFGASTYDQWVLTRWPDRTTQSLELFGEMFEHIEPLLASRIDDIVHRHEGLVMYVEDFDEYRWVILEDLLPIYGEPKAVFKPHSNEFRVRMPWGYCGNEIFNACSAAENAVTLAERANAAAFLLGAPSAQECLEESWKNLLVAQHHDVQICGLLRDSRKYLPASLELSNAVTHDSMSYLAEQFATEGAHNLVVYNTHSFDIAERVEVEAAQRAVAGYRVICGDEEAECGAVVLDSNQAGPNRSIIAFEARVPANTVKIYHVDTSRAGAAGRCEYEYFPGAEKCAGVGAEGGLLKTPLYDIVLDKYGIKSFYDKELGALIVDGAEGCLFRGIIEDADAASVGAWSVAIGGGGAKATYAGMIGGIPILFKMKFFGRLRRIDCRVRFIHNGERIGRDDIPGETSGFVHEDKLRFALNTRLGGDSVNARDLPYVIAETDDPLYIQGNYWAARSNADFGIAIFNRGCRGAVCNGAEFSLPLAYANSYVWGTRMLHGEFGHEFALYPFHPEEASAGYVRLHKAAISYAFPPLTIKTGGHGGKYAYSIKIADITGAGAGAAGNAGVADGADCCAGIDTRGGNGACEYADGGAYAGSSGVIMTAMYVEGDAVLLRVCNYGGAEEAYGGPVSPLGATGEQVTIMNVPTDTLAPTAAPAQSADSAAPGRIKPWEIVTHRIYRK